MSFMVQCGLVQRVSSQRFTSGAPVLSPVLRPQSAVKPTMMPVTENAPPTRYSWPFSASFKTAIAVR